MWKFSQPEPTIWGKRGEKNQKSRLGTTLKDTETWNENTVTFQSEYLSGFIIHCHIHWQEGAIKNLWCVIFTVCICSSKAFRALVFFHCLLDCQCNSYTLTHLTCDRSFLSFFSLMHSKNRHKKLDITLPWQLFLALRFWYFLIFIRILLILQDALSIT